MSVDAAKTQATNEHNNGAGRADTRNWDANDRNTYNSQRDYLQKQQEESSKK
jgi:hypothetical protein